MNNPFSEVLTSTLNVDELLFEFVQGSSNLVRGRFKRCELLKPMISLYVGDMAASIELSSNLEYLVCFSDFDL